MIIHLLSLTQSRQARLIEYVCVRNVFIHAFTRSLGKVNVETYFSY